jgi:hypothetical protein
MNKADIDQLMHLGTSDDGRLHVLLPDEFHPQIVAALLAVFANSVLDIAQEARSAAEVADEAIARAKRLTFTALRPDDGVSH